MNRLHAVFCFIIFMLILGLSCKHSAKKSAAMPPSHEVYKTLPKLAVFPTTPYQRDPHSGQSICPVCERSLQISPIQNNILEEFYQLLFFEFEQTYQFQVISQRTIEHALLPKGYDNAQVGDWQLLCPLADRMEINFILFSTLFRFEERQGEPYSVTKPASISFDLHFVRASDCQILWTRRYRETQKALTENIFEVRKVIERRVRWVTAHELAREGIQKIIATMPPPQSQLSKR